MSIHSTRRCDHKGCSVSVEMPVPDACCADVTVRLAHGGILTTPRGWTFVEIGRVGEVTPMNAVFARNSDAQQTGHSPTLVTAIEVLEFCPLHGDVSEIQRDETIVSITIIRVPMVGGRLDGKYPDPDGTYTTGPDGSLRKNLAS